jgi:AraC-like DNA-binding protein
MAKYNKTYDECYFLNYSASNDICLYEIGCQKCPPCYSFGPIIRSHYVLHYVIGGKGTLCLDNTEYQIRAREAFIMPPNMLCYYQADKQDPWNYMWIHIDGERVSEYLRRAGVERQQPIIRCAQGTEPMEMILNDICKNNQRELYCIGKLYELFEFITNQADTRVKLIQDVKQTYINIILDIIRLKYNENITVEHLADACGLERSYMTRLFKTAMGHSPQEYLINYRIRVAHKLLTETDWPVRNIAYAVGYSDSFAFSKAFKRVIGVSPMAFRTRLMKAAQPT